MSGQANDPNVREGRRRLRAACDLIASAVRLGGLDGGEVHIAVSAAVSEGADQWAEDVKDEYWRAAR